MVRILSMLPRLDARRFDRVSLDDWIVQEAGRGNRAKLLRMFFRVSTYADDARRLSAGAAIDQLKLALEGNVWYLDGGWQSIVDGLSGIAVGHGAEIRTGIRVEAVRSEPDGISVGLAGGDILRASWAILAVPPKAACALLDLPADASLSRRTRDLVPVRAACLDVALDELPRAGLRVAFGLDSPLYYSVHSASARLAPEGIAVLHTMKYLRSDSEMKAEDIEAELEVFLERLQPGWWSHVVVRRFLPGMMVAHSLPRPEESGLRGRPGVAAAERPGVFLAGDWVGPRGLLADASFASAEEAARVVLTALERPSARSERSAIHVAC
jgi:phytoene dehydrogenase-like protein